MSTEKPRFSLDRKLANECLEELEKEYLRIGSARCKYLEDRSQLSAFLLLGIRSVSLLRAMTHLLQLDTLDSYDSVRRAFVESWQLQFELRLRGSETRAQDWFREKNDAWKPNIAKLEEFIKKDGHSPAGLGREWGLLSEKSHPTYAAASDSCAIVTARRGISSVSGHLREEQQALESDYCGLLVRQIWLTLDGDSEFMSIPMERGFLKTCEELHRTYVHFLEEHGTENKTGEHREKAKNYFQNSKEAITAYLQPLWEDVKKNGRSVKFWLEVLGLLGLGAYVTVAALQWRGQITALRVDQRAWINISVGQAPLIEGKQIEMPIRVTNSGKTPAFNVQGVIVVNLLGVGEEPDFDYKSGHPFYAIDVGAAIPNSPANFSFPVLPKYRTPQEPLAPVLDNSAITQGIGTGKLYIAVHSKVTYDDVFGTHHWTTFCSYSANSVGLPEKPVANTCGQYNNVDRNN
jgi:hypothetical protein